jgi:hypothetical protein
MKKVNITISFEDEKLNALSFFMGKNGANPQKELEDGLEKLYEKFVPAEMREYIASRTPASAKDKPKRPAKPTVSKQAAPAPAQKPQGDTSVISTPPNREDK